MPTDTRGARPVPNSPEPQEHVPSRGHILGRGANRAELLAAVRTAENDAAGRREAAEKRANDIVAEGRRAALRVEEEAEKEGRALLKAAKEKAAAEMDVMRMERLAKISAESEALKAAARSRFPDLGKAVLKELEGGKDA